MKKALCIFFFWCLLFCFAAPCRASDLLEDLKREAGCDTLSDILPADMEEGEGLLDAFAQGGYTGADAASYLVKRLFSLLSTSLAEMLGLFCAILLVLLCAAYFGAMRHAFLRDTVGDVFEFVAVLVLSGVSFAALWEVFSHTADTLRSMSDFIGGMLPITGAVYSLSGGVVTATVQSAGVLAALSVLNALCVSYLLPLLCISFALSAAGAVSGVDFCSFARFLRRCVAFLCGIVFTVLLSVLYFQSAIAAASDTLTLRSARFAAANFVPAVGNLFAESSRTVFAAAKVLRSTLGVFGICVICWLIARPLLGLMVRRGLFSLLAAGAGALSLEREGRFLADCSETLGLAVAILLSCGIYFLLAFAIFVQIPIGG